jgi:hypothetical protein
MKPAFFGLPSRFHLGNPILIIDRYGLIGEPLALKFSDKFQIVFVSEKGVGIDKKNKNIIHIPFSGKFPVIPDGKYSRIIFVDEEGTDLELLPRIIRKVKAVNADFVFAQGLSRDGKYAVEEIYRLDSSVKIVLFGDIFINKLILRKENPKSVINNYIYQAQKFGKIQVLGDGLREAYPVFLQDVVNGLFEIVSKLHKDNSLFYIFPKHPPFELSLAHMIQKMNPEITIDFIKASPELKTISYPPDGKYLLRDQYPLAKMIRGINIRRELKVQNVSLSKRMNIFKEASVFIFWTLIFLLFIPLIFTVLLSLLGSGTLYFAEEEIYKGNFINAKNSLYLSEASYSFEKKISNILLKQIEFIGFKNNFDKFSQEIDSKREISWGLSQAFNSAAYFYKVMGGKSENSNEDFVQGQNSLKNSLVALNRAKIEGKIPKSILQNLEEITPLIKFLSNIVDEVPKICGMEGPRTYLILWQDNIELRPGGGAIRYYGILKFNLGKITEFSTHNVSDADKRLGGHVDPPFAIERYLLEKHWYLRDSNFNVDFVKSALSSSDFLFAETGQKIDGIMAVDTSFMRNILHAIGQVTLTDYKQAVNENNLYMIMQSHERESSFLKSLNEAIIKKIMGDRVNYFLIVKEISDSLSQKHLIITSKEIQNIFTVNRWSSALWDERKNGEGFVNDFLGINEANLGLNKANYSISRQVSQKVIVGNDGSISEELDINYKNQNTAANMDYKNYLRIILPKDTTLSEILLNGVPQVITAAVVDPLIFENKGFKPPQGLEVERATEGGKDVFGFLVKVSTGEIVKITLKYTLAKSISALNTFSYNLKLFKQPGIDSFPYSFSLIYPSFLNVIKNSDGANKDGEVAYYEEIKEDKNIDIGLTRK